MADAIPENTQNDSVRNKLTGSFFLSSIGMCLEAFFENLLMDANYELENRYLHIDYSDTNEIQSANSEISKCQNGTLNCTLEELAIIKELMANPGITQKSMAKATGKSERTIKRRMTALQEKGYIRRANGKRNGYWEVLVEL